MLKQTSKEFRKLFLLEFTKQLIDAYAPEDIAKLERILRKEKKEGTTIKQESKELVKSIIHEKEKELKFLGKEKTPLKRKLDFKRNLYSLNRIKPVLRIPETRLPQTFQYLKPTPTNTEIDLGKLNAFVQDPLVKVIACNGPDENIVVHGSMGTKPTNIILKKEEIDEIIKRFAEAAKIPQEEGIFKAVFGKLVLSAIISEAVGSKFVIRKIMYAPKYY